jgi:hypothetical protein
MLLRVHIAWMDAFPVDDGVEFPSHGLLVGVGLRWVPILVACPPVLYAVQTPLPINIHATLSRNTVIAVLIPIVATAVTSQPRCLVSAIVIVFWGDLTLPAV